MTITCEQCVNMTPEHPWTSLQTISAIETCTWIQPMGGPPPSHWANTTINMTCQCVGLMWPDLTDNIKQYKVMKWGLHSCHSSWIHDWPYFMSWEMLYERSWVFKTVRSISDRWHDMKWYDMKWHDMKWHDIKWHDMKWKRHDVKLEITWHDMTWNCCTHESRQSSPQTNEKMKQRPLLPFMCAQPSWFTNSNSNVAWRCDHVESRALFKQGYQTRWDTKMATI